MLAYGVLVSAPMVALADAIARRWYGSVIPDSGCRIDTNHPAVTRWIRTLIFWRMYETAELRMIARHLPTDLDVIELGGSLEVVASHLVQRLHPGRRVVSVEANPAVVGLLRRNLEADGPHFRAEVVHGAVAYDVLEPGSVEICVGDSTLAAWCATRPDDRTACRVPAITRSGLIDGHQIDQFALVADIEGAEAGLLIHDQAALAGCPIVIAELH